MKTFRRLEAGINPDPEISRFLVKRKFPHVPTMAGGLTYRGLDGSETSLAILSEFAKNCKDGWDFTLDSLGRYYERIGSLPEESREAPQVEALPLDEIDAEVPVLVAERLSTYVEAARLLGECTSALHLCLAEGEDEVNFAPEPFTTFYQRSLFQSMRNVATQSLGLLRARLKYVPEADRASAERVVALQPEILKRLRTVADVRISAMRLRIHGDYHLGQVLHTGKEFLIIDFEGEPARPLSERRFKRSPLIDVAGMLRSFDYAAHAALFTQMERGAITPENLVWVEGWRRYWTHWTSRIFLKAYLASASRGRFLPKTTAELRVLLVTSLINKALYELGYELNNRPDWVKIPVQGLLGLFAEPDKGDLKKHHSGTL